MAMEILQIVEPGRAEIVEVDRPSPAGGEVLVRVQAITSCPHWDMRLMDGVDIFGRPDQPQYPILPGREGHEMCGVVEEVGDGVTDFAPGQRVVTWRTMGPGRWGYYAQYAAISAEDLLPVPGDLPDEAIACLELAMCVSVSFLDMPDTSGLRFCVGGLGGAGLVAVQLAKAAGAAEVTGLDLLAERRALAMELGADRCLDPTSEAGAALREDRRGAHVDASIECSGSKEAAGFQMDIAGKWIAFFGVLRERPERTQRHQGLAFQPYGTHRREAAEYAMKRIRDRQLKLSPLVSQELALSRFTEGIEILRRKEAIKILYRPWD